VSLLDPAAANDDTIDAAADLTSSAVVRTAEGSGLSYQWYRGSSGDTSNAIGGATSSRYLTPPLISNTRYRVRVTNGIGSADSSTATMTVLFTDATLDASVPIKSVPIKSVHITEPRARIDALRAR